MQGFDDTKWKEAKPFIEGGIALILYIVWGNKFPGSNQDRCKTVFTQAQEFLNTFEDRNQIK